MRLPFFKISLLLTLSFVEGGFFVQLKTTSTIEKLLVQDDRIKASSHIRPLVESVFSFGDFEGFSGNFSKDIVKRLIKNDLVKNIVKDTAVKLFDSEYDIRLEDVDEYVYFQSNPWEADLDYETQFMAPRHLASLSRQGQLPFNNSVNYYYDKYHQGQDVTVYVIDTGIFKEHPEFEERVVEQLNFTPAPTGDSSGHGTHVAGVIGSKTFGVAKKVNIIDLKALDDKGSGSLTSVLGAIQHAAKHREANNIKGVINLSLGSQKNEVLNSALNAATRSGLVVIAAAGNFASDSCGTSPASADGVISVGAFDDRTDKLASFTNYGKCVDVLASGVNVRSVHHVLSKYTQVMSGTSMSAPSIAGLAAVLLSQGVEPRDVKSKLVELSRCNRIQKMIKDTPNRVAFNGINKVDDEYPISSMYDSFDRGGPFQPSFAKPIHGTSDYSSDSVYIASDDSIDEESRVHTKSIFEESPHDEPFDFDDEEIRAAIAEGIVLLSKPPSFPAPLIWK
jgi:subtilase-type proteinase RRT12